MKTSLQEEEEEEYEELVRNGIRLAFEDYLRRFTGIEGELSESGRTVEEFMTKHGFKRGDQI